MVLLEFIWKGWFMLQWLKDETVVHTIGGTYNQCSIKRNEYFHGFKVAFFVVNVEFRKSRSLLKALRKEMKPL